MSPIKRFLELQEMSGMTTKEFYDFLEIGLDCNVDAPLVERAEVWLQQRDLLEDGFLGGIEGPSFMFEPPDPRWERPYVRQKEEEK